MDHSGTSLDSSNLRKRMVISMQSLIYDNMAHESSETLIWTE